MKNIFRSMLIGIFALFLGKLVYAVCTAEPMINDKQVYTGCNIVWKAIHVGSTLMQYPQSKEFTPSELPLPQCLVYCGGRPDLESLRDALLLKR